MTTRIRSSPSEKPHAGICLPREHPDQAVVAAAATETTGQVGHGDFHDRAGVVREAARQPRRRASRARARPWLPLKREISPMFAGRPLHVRLTRHESTERAHASSKAVSGATAASREHHARPCLSRTPSRRSCPACRSPPARRRAAAADTGAIQHPGQQLAVIQLDDEIGEAERLQHLADRRQHLHFDHRRRRPDRVHVALVELAEAPARRPVGPPHRLDLIALEELGSLPRCSATTRASGTVKS